MKMKALLIDIDGTLLDFRQAEIRGISAVLEHYGIAPDGEKTKRYHDLNQRFWQKYERGEITRREIGILRYPAYFEELGLDVKVDPAVCERLYEGAVEGLLIVIDGAEEMLRYLSSRYLLYAASNGYSRMQRDRLERAGLLPYFRDLFISEDTGSQKPQKEYFDYCFARMPGILPERTLLVGDSLTSDIQGGLGAGCHVCWYNPGGQPLPEEVRPDFVVPTLGGVRKILERDAEIF